MRSLLIATVAVIGFACTSSPAAPPAPTPDVKAHVEDVRETAEEFGMVGLLQDGGSTSPDAQAEMLKNATAGQGKVLNDALKAFDSQDVGDSFGRGGLGRLGLKRGADVDLGRGDMLGRSGGILGRGAGPGTGAAGSGAGGFGTKGSRTSQPATPRERGVDLDAR